MAIPITQKAKSPCKYDIMEGDKQTLNYGGDNIAQMIDKSIQTDEKKEDSVEAPVAKDAPSNGSGGKNVFDGMLSKFNSKKAAGEFDIKLPPLDFKSIK
jgi:hypothetical protein